MLCIVWHLEDVSKNPSTANDDRAVLVSYGCVTSASAEHPNKVYVCQESRFILASASQHSGLPSKEVTDSKQNHSTEFIEYNLKLSEHVTAEQNVKNGICDRQPHSDGISAKHVTTLCLDALLAGLVIKECQRSQTFYKGFLQYACSMNGKTYPVIVLDKSECSSLLTLCSSHEVASPHPTCDDTHVYANVTVIKLQQPKTCILDYKWCYRLVGLAIRRHQLADTMNWLNTLGGGYSALGDYFQEHAQQAGQISRVQLQLALEMGEAPVMLRCHLYLALSGMQTAKLSLAKKIIRSTYHSAKQLPIVDHRLEAMCKGLWNKLRYLYQCERQRKSPEPDQASHQPRTS